MNKPFDKIKLVQLYALCNALADTSVCHVSNIKRKYLENGIDFDETLAFLEDLHIIKNNSGNLFAVESFSITHDSLDTFKQKLLLALFSKNCGVSEQLRNFLLQFQTSDDKIFFKATEIEKIKFSDTRNLLLEVGFITASIDNTTYFVNPNYTHLFIKQLNKIKLSPESLKRKQAENDSLGLSAELAVIEFEKKRLKSLLLKPNDIEHTSVENVLAGFDIKSFENYLDSNSNRISRYIEVKAVSDRNFKFYWSRNEMEIAKILGSKYFLYLLPVITNNTFDFDNLLIISNPFKYVYSNPLTWQSEEENISFSKIIDN